MTPFTNTLPIRRLPWEPGQARDLSMVYVAVPEMTARPARQRYTCLETGDGRGRLPLRVGRSGGTCRSTPTGLVVDYPDFWRRLGAGAPTRASAPMPTRQARPRLPSRGMDYGLCLPNFQAGASAEGIEAGADVAARAGWSTVWTTDHVMVPTDAAGEYGQIYDAILTLAWVGARQPGLRLGTSVIVVPQRNAVVLAKELASLNSLSHGRLIAGVGIGWNEVEFGNLGHGRPVPRPGRLPRRDDPALAPSLVRLDRAVPRPVPLVRRLRLRARCRSRAPTCRSSSGGRSERALRACRLARRRLPLDLHDAGPVRRARRDDPGGRGGGRPARARVLGQGPRRVRGRWRGRRVRVPWHARTRWRPRCGRSPTPGSAISP